MSRLYLWIALLPVLWAHSGHAAGSADTWRSPTTLDVVLVTFDDETTASGTYDYYLHDRPYGTNPNRSEDPSDRYLLRDFERLFVGGYDEMGNYDAGTVFVGDTVTVATDHTLPEVFGSVRAYYNSVSNGAFVLNVRMINPVDEHGYPRWIELRNTKSHYAETRRAGANRDNFWNDAYNTAMDSISCWSPSVPDPSDVDCGDSEVSDYAITDIPGPTYTLDQRRRHKVVYLYSGAVFTRENFIGLLHPQADTHTATTPGAADDVGYRYVMGEREGWGNASRGIDEFAGIFTHAHEIGHLLGFYHGAGQWTTDPDPNPYRSGMYTDDLGANLMDWGLMQGRGSGPEAIDNGYHGVYSSCPNPLNPFYRWDLGWLNPTEITENVEGYVIEPGTVHLITRGSVEYLLERRAHD